jgi:uncharacterized membrane protein YhaH (DUF805 family)
MSWYLKALKQYAVFSGRAQRMELWMFILFNWIIVLLLAFIEGALGIAPDNPDTVLDNIYSLAVFCPSLAVGIRRLHDTDRSGWWILVPFVNFVFWCIDGTPGDNRFGPDPKGRSEVQMGSTAPQTSDFSRDSSVQPSGWTSTAQPTPEAQVPVTPPQTADFGGGSSAQPSEPGSLDTRIIVKVTAAQASEGCSIQLATGSGEQVVLAIPAGTGSGSHLRVPGGGIREGNQVGDQWVRVNIEG